MPATIERPIVSIPLVGSTAQGVEAFRAGTHTDSAGNRREWAIADMQEAADAYNEAVANGLHEAPVLHGHAGSYAYGWIARAYVQGDTLLLDYRDVESEFAERVNQRRHPKRSISFFHPDHGNNPTPGRWNIRHVAYLPAPGEDGPAVKGLSDHKFDAGPADHRYEFAEEWVGKRFYGFEILTQILRKLRDRAIEETSVEAAEQQYPADLLDALQRSTEDRWLTVDEYDAIQARMNYIEEMIDGRFETVDQRLRAIEMAIADQQQMQAQMQAQQYSDSSSEDMPVTQPKSQPDKQDKAPPQPKSQPQTADFSNQLAEVTAAMQDMTANLTSIRADLDAQRAELAAHRQRQKEAEIRNFATAMVSEAKMTPEDVEAEVARLARLDNENPVIQFGDSDDEKMTPLAFAMQEIRNRRPLWSNHALPTRPSDHPGSFSSQGSRLDSAFDPDSLRADEEVKRYAQENNCSYAEALDALVISGQIVL